MFLGAILLVLLPTSTDALIFRFFRRFVFHLKDEKGLCAPYTDNNFCNKLFCERYYVCNTAADPPREECTRKPEEFVEKETTETEDWICGRCS